MDAQQVLERYLAGRLPPAEAARFEEHSLACPECLDRLEATDALRRSLRAMAAQEVAAGVVRATLLSRIARSRAAPWALGFLFVAALLPSVYWARESERLDAELAAARVESAPRTTRPAERATPAAAPGEIAALRAQIAAGERQAEADRREREKLAAELARAQSPRINLAVVPLSPERSAMIPGAQNASPSTRISLAPGMEWVVLALELDASDRPSYRATLAGPGGASLWRGSGLVPDAQGTLNVALPAALLPTGDLTLRVEGLDAKGKPVPVASFTFRVLRVARSK
ncbi:MAG TPA: zf-HC2 domain-containing protein [Thermoanaerobaculia bacterium]|jgi:hypothetical protein|nr:zf-HC2 domain-containing protein [Thermoanaerobaculia bacterium]